MNFYRKLLFITGCIIILFIIFLGVINISFVELSSDDTPVLFDRGAERIGLARLSQDTHLREIAVYEDIVPIKQKSLYLTRIPGTGTVSYINITRSNHGPGNELHKNIPAEPVHAKNERNSLTSFQDVYPNENVQPIESELCDHECKAFQQSLETWPVNKSKAAIYYLTRKIRLKELKTSLTSVELYFNSILRYPVIIFHESDMNSDEIRREIRSYIKSPVYFQLVSFKTPSFLIQSAVVVNISCFSYISYRHMCRFHALGIYQQPILKGLDYVWRLDDDSYLLGEVKYDVFEVMKKRRILYGYKLIHWDSYDCTEGLWPATRKYIETNQIKAEFFSEWKVAQIYYNNFEISALSLWTSREYQDYIQYIDRLGGIYYHRWGDAPIKSLAVSMFVPRSRTHLFSDIQYQHTSFYNNSFR